MGSEHRSKGVRTFQWIMFVICIVVIYISMKYIDTIENNFNNDAVEQYTADIIDIKKFNYETSQSYYKLTLKINDSAGTLGGKQCRIETSTQTYKVGDTIDIYTNSKHRNFELTELGVQAAESKIGIILIGAIIIVIICLFLITNAPYIIKTKDKQAR